MTAKLNLTPEQKLIRINRLSADRSASYYDNKKDIILQRRKDKRAALRAQKQATEPVIETPPVIENSQHPPIVFDFSAHIVNDDEDVKKFNQQMSNVIDETPKYNLAQSIAKLQQLGMKDQNLKTYINSIKQLMRITGCEDLVDCLKDSDKIINLIENGKKKNGSAGYATNSKIGLYQVIVYIIDAFKLDINKEPYNKQRLLHKIEDETRVENNKEKLVPTWEELLTKTKTKYGPDSKEYVMIRLYQRVPSRDDFKLLITDKLDGYDTKINYLVLRYGKPSKVILHQFKTADKYGKSSFVLSAELSQLVNDYRFKHKINLNNYLFGTMPQTGFISKTLKDLGYGDQSVYNQTGISFLRKMSASNTPTETPEQKLDLANKMGHSTNTQKHYKSKISKK